jgi:hypothetical protein
VSPGSPVVAFGTLEFASCNLALASRTPCQTPETFPFASGTPKLASQTYFYASVTPNLASVTPYIASGTPYLASGTSLFASGSPDLASGTLNFVSGSSLSAYCGPFRATRASVFALGATVHNTPGAVSLHNDLLKDFK